MGWRGVTHRRANVQMRQRGKALFKFA